MLRFFHRQAAQYVLAALAGCLLPLAAQAGTINIILSDMDVNYMGSTSGGSFYDAMGGFSGGNLAEGTSDDISSAVYEMDGNPVGTLINTAANGDDIHVDFRVTNVGATIAKNVFFPTLGNNNGAFGLDLFTDSGTQLRLGTDEVSVFINNNVMFITGSATLLSQGLPFGLALDPSQPVQFAFTATLPAVPNTANMGMAVGSGALTISGVMAIPEPAEIALLLPAAFIVGLALARRQRSFACGFAQRR
jgi:hypothetical protein